MRYGPLSLNDLVTGATPYGDYRIGAQSVAKDSGVDERGGGSPALAFDFFGTDRPQGPAYDIGAHEIVQAGGGNAAVLSQTQVNFGVVNGGTANVQTITLTNTGKTPLTGIKISLTAPK